MVATMKAVHLTQQQLSANGALYELNKKLLLEEKCYDWQQAGVKRRFY